MSTEREKLLKEVDEALHPLRAIRGWDGNALDDLIRRLTKEVLASRAPEVARPPMTAEQLAQALKEYEGPVDPPFDQTAKARWLLRRVSGLGEPTP